MNCLTMKERPRRLTLSTPALLASCLLAPCLLTSPVAHAETLVGGQIDGTVGYSTSPFGTNGSSAGAGTATARVLGRARNTHSTGMLDLDAAVTHTEYSRIYDGKTDYNASARLQERLSPRTNLSLSGRFDSSVVDNNTGLLSPIFFDPDLGLPPLIDPSSGQLQRQRRNSYTAGLSLSHQFSQADTVTVGANGTAVRFKGTGTFQEYDYATANVAYMHQFSEKLSLGGSFAASRTNYLGSNLGDARSHSPQLNARLDLGRGWSLSAAGGVTFTESNVLFGTRNSTAASGSVQLCKRVESRFNGCLSASRSVLPSSLGAVGNQTSLGALASYQLDEFSSINGSVSYARSSRTGAASSQDFLVSNIGYSRRLTSRLSGTVSAGYSDSFSGFVTNKSNLSGTVGISYRIGRL